VTWLADIWSRPTAEELRGLVGEYLKEELLSREAREMKLDENDIVIRRRLAQKLSFIVRDTAEMAEPSDEELHQLYDENAGLFQTGSRISFRQIYFNPNNRADARHDALLALAGLSAMAEPTELGDRLMVEANSRNATLAAFAAHKDEVTAGLCRGYARLRSPVFPSPDDPAQAGRDCLLRADEMIE
jgi:hypothetical protein